MSQKNEAFLDIIVHFIYFILPIDLINQTNFTKNQPYSLIFQIPLSIFLQLTIITRQYPLYMVI